MLKYLILLFLTQGCESVSYPSNLLGALFWLKKVVAKIYVSINLICACKEKLL